MLPDQNIIVPTKMALVGILIGVLSGLAIAQMQPGPTLAAVVHNPPFTIGRGLDPNILKLDGDYFAVGHLPGTSLEPNSSVTVRKVGYGHTSLVTINTTPSGTYSTDGLASPYVRYPGIYKEPLRLLLAPFGGAVLGWSRLSGWVKIPLLGANSFGYLDDDSVPASHDGVCVSDAKTGACR